MKAIEYIRLIGKEFKDTSDDELMLWIEMVRPMVSKKQFGKLYDQAIAFLVCHKMKMAGHGESPLGDMGAIGIGFAVGSVSEGGSSISYGANQEFQPRNGCRTRLDRIWRPVPSAPANGHRPDSLQRRDNRRAKETEENGPGHPIATATTLGGVKVPAGSGLKVDGARRHFH